ncbi:MAG: efflux RND transporter periplasmic adaptor subunit [Chitinivibrionales bacterium]
MKMRSMVISSWLIFCACGQQQPAQKTPEDDSRQVLEAVRISRGIINRQVESSGTISGIEEAWIVAQAQGTIKEIWFELGDRVKEGSILVLLEDNAASYNLAQAKRQLESARLSYQSVKKLYDSEAASEAEFANAQGQLNKALAFFEQAQQGLQNTRIITPITGFIAQKTAELTVGNYLAAGTRIAHIVDLSRIKVSIPLGEEEVILVRPGSPAVIIPYSGCPIDSQIPAEVTAVAAGADQTTGSFTAIVEADNPCDSILRAGMTVTVLIDIIGRDSTLIVPTSALVNRDSVFVFSEGKAYLRRIVTGETIGNRTAVKSGLDTGDIVIVTPPPQLTQGETIDTALLGESGVWE